MSCGLHDVARLEQRGVPTAFLITDAFRDSVGEQLPSLGLGAYIPVWVPHPVAGLPRAAARDRADAALDAVRAVLLGSAIPLVDAGVGRAASAASAAEPGCDDVACAVDLAERG